MPHSFPRGVLLLFESSLHLARINLIIEHIQILRLKYQHMKPNVEIFRSVNFCRFSCTFRCTFGCRFNGTRIVPIELYILLRSAVVIYSPSQVMDPQLPATPGACGSRQKGHVVILDQSQRSLRKFSVEAGTTMPIKIGTFRILPTGLHGLCFGFCFAGLLRLRSLLHGPLSRVHFGESLVVRLYSEIDHIHLSSEAQCVSHH